MKTQRNHLAFDTHHKIYLGLLSLLIACSTKQEKANFKQDTYLKKIVINKNTSTSRANQLSKWIGNYQYKCGNDTSFYLILSIELVNKKYIAKLRHSSSVAFAQGSLNLDSTTYDKLDSIYTFTDGRTVYGFTQSTTESKLSKIVLYNEDYKLQLKQCSDSKSLIFSRE